MKRLIRWAARLYPSAWRARYGPEFRVLLDDVEPAPGDFWNVLAGAMKMRMTTRNFGGISALGALAGLVLAAALTYVQPKEYVSTAVLQLRPSAPTVDWREHLLRLEEQVMSRTSLAKIITQPSLDLYHQDRTQRPLEDIVADMRNHGIRIQPSGGSSTFAISYAYPDRYKARAVVRQLVDRFVEQNVVQQIPPAADRGGITLEVLDPASLPDRASSPRWSRSLLLGTGAGLLAGIVAGFVVRGPRRRTLRVAGAGVAGFLIVGAASLLLPNQYISSAVLRARPGALPVDRLLDSDLLAKVVAAQGARAGASSVDELRKRLEIRAVGPLGAYVISFRASDRFAAQAVVREIVNRTFEKQRISSPQPSSPAVQVLDPASMPDGPSSPNRLTIAFLGLAAGLLLGAWWMRENKATVPA